MLIGSECLSRFGWAPLARTVGEFFNLKDEQMDSIMQEVKRAVSNWKGLAVSLGIPPAEISLMEDAFKF